MLRMPVSRWFSLALAPICLSAVAGCGLVGSSTTLRAESLGRDPVYLALEYVTAFYAESEATETSFFLSDVPLQQLLEGEVSEGNIVHINLLWIPDAGATPMDSSATNTSIRYIVIADGEVGVYGGAGFALPHGQTGDDRLSISILDASLTLLESTGGFVDLLSPARLTGRITATLDEQRTRQIQFAVSQFVTNALGRSRFVRGFGSYEVTSSLRHFVTYSEPSSAASAWVPKAL